ncbi:MAG: hypothetical protein AAF198_04020 [Pseudomonadota bacterium]
MGSLSRMGRLSEDEPTILRTFFNLSRSDFKWRAKSDLVVDYERARQKPTETILDIAEALDQYCSHITAKKIASALSDLGSQSRKTLDRTTHLHPDHVGSKADRAKHADAVIRKLKAMVQDYAEAHKYENAPPPKHGDGT